MIIQFIMVIATLACIFFVGSLPIFVGAWILFPLDRAAKAFKRPTRFSILDFFGLVFLVQMPMALTHALVPQSEEAIYWILMIIGWVASTAVWAAAVKTFSNAGISEVWTRALLVFFVLPMAYFAPFAIVIMALVAVNEGALQTTLQLSAIAAVLAVGIIIAGTVSRRIARPLLTKNNNPFDPEWTPAADEGMDDEDMTSESGAAPSDTVASTAEEESQESSTTATLAPETKDGTPGPLATSDSSFH